MENLTSDQDELYYTAKNFNKLKFSNTAYIENTTKDKQENLKEIENLKKEYEKLKSEVTTLKKKTLYSANSRLKSASNNVDMENSELNIIRLKLDHAKAQKMKARNEWKKLEENLKELKSESRQIGDDNNPYMRRIKLLENKLDKAMIKYNEAMSIRRTYEQILNRLKEERAGYDNQIAAIQKSLKAKGHDCEEFKLLLQDAKQARAYSELLLKNTELSRDAFEQHFEQLIKAHEKETKNDIKNDKLEENKRKLEKIDIQRTMSEESLNLKNSHNNELDKRVKEYEEADKLIRETTGADDINEICQKFSSLRETKDKLKKERKDLEKMCEHLNKKKDELVNELNKLKYQGQDEITRKEIEDNEKTADRTLKACEDARQKLKKSEKLMVDIRAGINMLSSILKLRIVFLL
jgi:chromosome segregation ATPase